MRSMGVEDIICKACGRTATRRKSLRRQFCSTECQRGATGLTLNSEHGQAAQRLAMKRPEVRAKKSAASKQRWAQPGVREVARERMKDIANRPDVRARRAAGRAASMRRQASCPEHYIKGFLDARGVDYVWQHIVGDAVVDFYIPALSLVLQYDGSYWHSQPGIKVRDAAQTAALEAAGYRVIRVSEKTLDIALRETFAKETAWN